MHVRVPHAGGREMAVSWGLPGMLPWRIIVKGEGGCKKDCSRQEGESGWVGGWRSGSGGEGEGGSIKEGGG